MSNSDIKINVPHIIHIFSSFGLGGVPIKICHSINYFADKAKHTIISTHKEYASKSLLNENVSVDIPDTMYLNEGSLFKRLQNYRSYLKKTKPDLLITYNWGAVEWALANSFGPIVRHIHVESGFGPDEAVKTLKRRDLFRRFSLRNIEYLSVPSQTLIAIAKDKWHIPEKKIKYIPNGVDLKKFEMVAENTNLEGFIKNENETIIGTIAPLRPEKNISRMITAFYTVIKNNPDIKTRLIIMGEGVEKPKLEKLVHDYSISDRVIFTGHISKPENAIGILDIFAISSDTEQMPNAVNEAMAANLPIIGVNVGDVKHMVSDENKKFIIDYGNENAFSIAMANLIKDKDSQKSIGNANLKHVRKYYDRVDMYKKYAELWQI